MEVGQKVTYISFGKTEPGIVKSLSDDEHVFVVYHCAGDWTKYADYTAARTRISDLVIGWDEENPETKEPKSIPKKLPETSKPIIRRVIWE